MVMKPLWVLTSSIPGAGGPVVIMAVSVATVDAGRLGTTAGSGGFGKTIGGTITSGNVELDFVGHGPFTL